MRLYKQPHAFYAGIDLHARTMFTHVLDDRGRTVFERDLPACPEAFLDAVQPFRQGLHNVRLLLCLGGALLFVAAALALHFSYIGRELDQP